MIHPFRKKNPFRKNGFFYGDPPGEGAKRRSVKVILSLSKDEGRLPYMIRQVHFDGTHFLTSLLPC